MATAHPPIRRRRTELTPQLRSRLCELRSLGLSFSQIHRHHPEVCLKTIQTTVYRENHRINNESRKRSGAPRKLSEEQRDHIYDLATHNPHIKNRDLLEEVDEAIKKRSIQRLLREMGKRKWKQKQRPEIKAYHAEKRLEWAHTYEQYTSHSWASVKWSDECTVERGRGIQPVWTFTRPSDQMIEQDVHEKRCGKSVKKMFWAAFGQDRRTGLVPLDGDPESRRGGVTAKVIVDLYQAFLPTILQPGDIFMQDNATVHTARITQAILRNMGVTVMVWPPYSPDLNPIENLWGLMKAEIYKLYPELEYADDTEDTLAKLIEAAKEAWQEIDSTVLYNLSITMPHRVQAVIAADGWYTKY
jgi:transposase